MTETAEWLTRRLPELSISSYQSRYVGGLGRGEPSFVKAYVDSVAVEDCNLRFRSVLIDQKAGGAPTRYSSVYNVPLAEVDPATSGVISRGGTSEPGSSFQESIHWSVILDMRGRASRIGLTDGEHGGSKTVWRAWIAVASKESGEQVYRGLQRAMELCGVKKDLF